MGSERLAGKRPPPTPKAVQRRKLSNITNLPSWHESTEEGPVKSKDFDLQQEVARLKGELENSWQEVTRLKSELEAQAAHIEKLENTVEQKSAQNEEIIQHYYRQYKELEQGRQEMKLLQHEYTQMCAVYKIHKSELQSQLEDANEKIRRLTDDRNSQQQHKKPPPPSTHSKKRRSTRIIKVRSYCPASIKQEPELPDSPEFVVPPPPQASSPPVIKPETQATRRASGRPQRRAAETITSYKEPPLNTKMRRSH